MPVYFDVISAQWGVVSVRDMPVVGIDPERPELEVPDICSGAVVTLEVNVEVDAEMGGPYIGFLWVGPGKYEWREGTSPGSLTVTMPSKISPDPEAPPMMEFVELYACGTAPPPIGLCDGLLLCELYYAGYYCDPFRTTGTTSGIRRRWCPTDGKGVYSTGCTSLATSEGR